MKNVPSFKKTAIAAVIAAVCHPCVWAAPLDFSTLPPGLVAIPPTPNVILSVDDSGSMSEQVGGGDTKTKMFRLKEALGTVFNDKLLLPDGKIRLAWQVMHNNGSSPGAANLTVGAVNSMKVLDDTHRANFLSFAASLSPGSGTPSHRMMKQAYGYMKSGKSVNSPWAYTPGTKETPYLGCRRSYHIFMTDGGWNGYSASELPGEADNTDAFMPSPDNSILYDTTSPQTNVYRGAQANLLADWAMKMWREDLQPDIDNLIKPSTTDGVPATETHGATTLERYWNPKHNPAKWQHLVNYTIGYGTSAYTWPSAPKWSMLDDDNYGGDYTKLVAGTATWVPNVLQNLNSNNPAELWHIAINSRGKFYPTGPGRKYDLKDAFKKILETINLENTADVASMAGSASTNIRTDLQRFTAGYDPKKWSGYVRADKVDTSGAVSPDPGWGVVSGSTHKTTANKLDARDISSRVILTTNDTTNLGVSFEWEATTTKLSAAQKALLDDGGLGESRTNFIRGDRSLEEGTPSKPFRIRDSRQGDIGNSNIWYVDKPASNYSFSGYKSFVSTHKNRLPMIYVGGNDGMLHGFSGVDGEEQIAYVPKAVIPELSKLSDPAYVHRYYVDGSPFTGDANIAGSAASPDWRTLLVGSLGAGGKGYFILDVTQPGNKAGTVASSFSTANASSLVVMDKTLHPSAPIASGSDDEDIGHIFHPPVMDDNNPFKASQVALMNDNRWAVILGNGYNSKNERPVLVIQYLDGLKEIRKIVATGNQTVSTPIKPDVDANVIANGLSAPKPVDINSDGKVDIVYAGDLKGNLWKFDLTSSDANVWSVASWGSADATPCDWKTTICKPLFTAIHSGKRQPITAPPTVKANDRGAGGMMVAFGTGANLTDNDRSSTDVQSVYSVLDNTTYKIVSGKVVVNTDTTDNGVIPVAVGGLTDLVKQDMVDATGIAGQGVSSSRRFWKMTQNEVNYDSTKGAVKKGWYFNFQVTSERVLRPMTFFDSSNNLMVFSVTPAYGGNGSTDETCEPAGTPEKAYLTLMNIMDGKKPGVQVMDRNGDGYYNTTDDGVSRMTLPPGAISSVVGKKTLTLSGGDNKPDKLARMPEQPMRPSWRQLQ
ncbi:pilus assembly protein [Acidovorax sp. RAC01]|uniref:pilus assembly protein n=1 Tax=Acidovorax sp. RAC01 TaxID=1842533 RepID=UPI00083E8D30|nr:PilC/PilY family type IV pilus protein [Acidovorax sp. RAC01]AOG23739.1 neisseria PilC beta-propeller domain protein [Acidovorax sp. RAC01]